MDIADLDMQLYIFSKYLGAEPFNLRQEENSDSFNQAGGTMGSDVTLPKNLSLFIRCHTMAVGAALAH